MKSLLIVFGLIVSLAANADIGANTFCVQNSLPDNYPVAPTDFLDAKLQTSGFGVTYNSAALYNINPESTRCVIMYASTATRTAANDDGHIHEIFTISGSERSDKLKPTTCDVDMELSGEVVTAVVSKDNLNQLICQVITSPRDVE